MYLVHIKLELFTIMFKMGVSPLAFRALKMRFHVFSDGTLKNGATGL